MVQWAGTALGGLGSGITSGATGALSTASGGLLPAIKTVGETMMKNPATGKMTAAAPSVWESVGTMLGNQLGNQAMSGMPSVRSLTQKKSSLSKEQEKSIWDLINEMSGR